MSKYRHALPQLSDRLFLADGGIETTLIYHDGFELPHFAAFHLLQSPAGEAALRKYFAAYAQVAQRHGLGLVLESATWRASSDWGLKLGYTFDELSAANRRAISLLEEVRAEFETEQTPIVISGCVGPRGDGYVVGQSMTEHQSQEYHSLQIDTLAETAADMICAITMNNIQEAIGIARAAQAAGLPLAISFTVETDGWLPTGQSLRFAIEQVDQVTGGYPEYYMINCAHPAHFAPQELIADEPWVTRIGGLRANASIKSHAELNEASELDEGNPSELAARYRELVEQHPHLSVLGGCCGTDHRHIEQIAAACAPLFASRLS